MLTIGLSQDYYSLYFDGSNDGDTSDVIDPKVILPDIGIQENGTILVWFLYVNPNPCEKYNVLFHNKGKITAKDYFF